ncbi:MAG: phosphate ABC transporter permease subunit PstC [Candidatus Cloacimonadota bacterium]|nr:MAG: phosphate ABC transporter permease subunit PstC [Candidatus Cloacimonadota bacterium]
MLAIFDQKTGVFLLYLSQLITVSILFLFCIAFFINAAPAIPDLFYNLTSTAWNPAENKFGLLPMVYSTALVSLIALFLSIPPALCCAIFLSEYLLKSHRNIIKSLLELLAGIPSIVYGLLGIQFLAPFVAHVGGVGIGRSILTASILLAVMVLPLIMTLSEDALHRIPNSFRESSFALGLTKTESIFTVLLPMAWPGILGAFILAMGRALGETMAVMLVIGSIDRLPSPIYNLLQPGQTLTSKLGREFGEVSVGSLHFNHLVLIGLLLFIAVMIISFIAQNLLKSKGYSSYE